MKPLYCRLLGDTWYDLPKVIRDMHELGGNASVAGFAKVERGRGLLSWLLGSVFGFPAAGQNIPVSVNFIINVYREVWQRDFTGKKFSAISMKG